MHGIEIDRCDSCGGVWLDAGEYDVIRARLTRIRPTSSGARAVAVTKAHSKNGFAWSGTEVGLEIGDELLIRAVFWVVASQIE